MGKKKKSKKGGKKAGIVAMALLSVFLALPAVSEAGDFGISIGDIPTRVVAGYELKAGLKDPGEGVSVGLNNILGVLNEHARLPGLIVTWREQKVLELGALSGGYAGAAGSDSDPQADSTHFFVGAGGYLLEYIKGDVVWIIDRDASSNWAAYAGADVAKLGPKLVDVIGAAWQQTGL